MGLSCLELPDVSKLVVYLDLNKRIDIVLFFFLNMEKYSRWRVNDTHRVKIVHKR